MKKFVVLSVIFSLLVSLAAPYGAVFALEEVDVSGAGVQLLGQVELVERDIDQQEVLPEAQIGQSDLMTEDSQEDGGEKSATDGSPEVIAETVVNPVVNTTFDKSIEYGPETTPIFAISAFQVTSGLEFIEFYNQGSAHIDVSGISIKVSASTADGVQLCIASIDDKGWLLSKEYLYVIAPINTGVDARKFTNDCEFSSDITRIEVFYNGSRIQMVDGIKHTDGQSQLSKGVWRNAGIRKENPTAIKQDGSFDKHYIVSNINDPEKHKDSRLYVPPATSPLKIIELLPRPQSTCLPSHQDIECGDYVKIVNDSDEEVNLANFRVRIGSKSSNATATTSFNWHEATLNPARDELVLPKGGVFILRYQNDTTKALNLSNSSSQVWIEDYLGLQVYDEVSYSDMDKAVAFDRSWAYDSSDKTWEFGIPSPTTFENYFPTIITIEEPGKGGGDSSLKPCADDQFRHPETNRCRKIASAEEVADCGEGRERNPLTNRCRNIPTASQLASCKDGQYRSEETNRCRLIALAGGTLQPCKEGQYRSEETNRCRSIASAASALKPCADDQFRNPETNRCKKIASVEELSDCGEGRERNPETNRCRNVLAAATIGDVPFAPEQVTQTTQGMAHWWAIGGLSLLALAYAGWQWRFEVSRLTGRIAQVFSSKTKG